MKQWKKQLSAALCAALLLGCVSMPALAEQDEEYDLSDIPGAVSYTHLTLPTKA